MKVRELQSIRLQEEKSKTCPVCDGDLLKSGVCPDCDGEPLDGDDAETDAGLTQEDEVE